MAYIGKTPTVGNFQVCDAIAVVNGQAAYTLQVGGVNVAPESANHMLVSLNGILQKPGSSFTISGSTMTFASNLATGDVIDFVQILGNVLDLGQPSDDTVKTASIQANAVTGAKLNTDIISAQTALSSAPADTDEFLVSDAGTIKRIDYSLIKATSGLGVADQWRVSSDATMASGSTDITSNIEQIDTSGQNTVGSDMSVSSGLFTFPETGIYLVRGVANFKDNGSSRYTGLKLRATFNGGSSYTTLAESYDSITQAESHTTYANLVVDSMVNVGNTSNDKVIFTVDTSLEVTLVGDSGLNATYFTFLKMN